MNKKEFNELTNEITEMLDAYNHCEHYNDYFGVNNKHPYTSKLYCSNILNGERKAHYFEKYDYGIWIFELQKLIKKWCKSECCLSYRDDFKCIWDFMFQIGPDDILATDVFMQNHKQLLKEFYCDFVTVYLKRYAKANVDNFARLYLEYRKRFEHIENLLLKHKLSWLGFDVYKFCKRNNASIELLSEINERELVEYLLS